MLRRQMKKIIWCILLISVLLTRNSQCSPTSKTTARNATKAATTKSTTTLVTTAKPSTRTTASHTGSTRNATQSKKSNKRTTTAKPPTTESSIAQVLKMHVESTAATKQSNKKRTSTTTTTTTLSPIEVMNRLYQMHGMASSGSSYHKPSSYSSSNHGSSMDDIYKQHALALAHASSGSKHNKKPEESNYDSHYSGSGSSTTRKPSAPYKSNNMEQIYQQHSHLPSAMHHIMSAHSAPSSSSSSSYSSSSSSSSSRPQKTKSKTPQNDGSSTALSMFMQPLLKQLTPVGAGISVVLAPLLLFNGFLTFFSNISRFLNNFAQTMLPARRPINSNQGQNQNFAQNIGGPAHLRRQPRDWFENLQYFQDMDDLTEQILKAIQAGQQ